MKSVPVSQRYLYKINDGFNYWQELENPAPIFGHAKIVGDPVGEQKIRDATIRFIVAPGFAPGTWELTIKKENEVGQIEPSVVIPIPSFPWP